MGFFSWKTSDTDKSICNSYSGRDTFTVFLKDHKGNVWREDNYEGYGEFGGKDYHELVAEMNGISSDRIDGIGLACYPNDRSRWEPHVQEAMKDKNPIFPIIVEREDYPWWNENPVDCEFQGYFYDEECEDCEW